MAINTFVDAPVAAVHFAPGHRVERLNNQLSGDGHGSAIEPTDIGNRHFL